ncbi:MAG: hypothetical protein ACR2FN_01125 [Chitinophagaceae bacterium]
MKQTLAIFCLLIFNFSCKKDTSNCDTWHILYWQGTNTGALITTSYKPYYKDISICASGKDTVFPYKVIIINRVDSDLYDYATFEGKK